MGRNPRENPVAGSRADRRDQRAPPERPVWLNRWLARSAGGMAGTLSW